MELHGTRKNPDFFRDQKNVWSIFESFRNGILVGLLQGARVARQQESPYRELEQGIHFPGLHPLCWWRLVTVVQSIVCL